MRLVQPKLKRPLLAFVAGITSIIGLVMTMPDEVFMILLVMPLRVRLGVSVMYSVITMVLIYLILKTKED